MESMVTGGPVDPAEVRVRALRDTVAAVAERLESDEPIAPREVHDRIWRACAAIEEGDLGGDGATVGLQFQAMFDRLRELAEQHPDPVPTNSLGLPGDARFLRDMVDYLTRRYGLEDE